MLTTFSVLTPPCLAHADGVCGLWQPVLGYGLFWVLVFKAACAPDTPAGARFQAVAAQQYPNPVGFPPGFLLAYVFQWL